MAAEIKHRLFTVEDYYRMAEAGILSPDDRVELINGEVVQMSPIGIQHMFSVNQLTTLLVRKAGRAAIVSVQNPVRLNMYSEPQPDVALLRPPADRYRNSHPAPDDVLLIIEVADTTVRYDRRIKMPLYAQAGIAESWMVDVPGEAVEIYSEPLNGVYQKVRRANRGEALKPVKLSRVSIKVDDILA